MAVTIERLLASSPDEEVVQQQVQLVCQEVGIKPNTNILELPDNQLETIRAKLALARQVVDSSRSRR